jgi:4'-phosphopantetheinyl transferase
VHVWSANLDSPGWPSADLLPSAERDRAARLRPVAGRRRWVAARWALREVLARCLERAPTEIELRLGARGKPRLADPARLQFNLSHSAGLALVAVSREREVGVDVERVDRRRDVLALAPRLLDPAEAAVVSEAPAGARAAAFHAAWARREAVAKCLGRGLGAPLPDLPVAVRSIDASADFAAALAVSGREMPALQRFSAEPAKVRSPSFARA